MDNIVIGKNREDKYTISKDSNIIINNDVQSNYIEFNIINCKVKIIDMSLSKTKIWNFLNSEATLVEIIDGRKENNVVINNDNSRIEYNVIDLCNSDIQYKMEQKSIMGGSNIINIASICYKNKNKNYIVSTSNMTPSTTNEINCFGMVKDKSVLNYEVASFIEKGAKQSVVRQSSNILLFDESSFGKNNPILLIEENDVKASHGSSIGKIDDDTMFYLCSRGLTKNEATNLICLGKVEYLIKKISDEKIKESLVNNFRERMG